MRRQLWIVRHAKSSWDDASLADHDRPLAPRGAAEGKRLAAYINALSEARKPSHAYVSTSLRTRQTFDLLRPALPNITPEFVKDLYEASPEGLIARIRAIPSSVSCAMIVAHNDGLQDVLRLLVPQDQSLEAARLHSQTFAPCSFAIVEFDCDWSAVAAGKGILRDLKFASDLKRAKL